ncbi:MAG: hypothetical protein ABIK09_15095 [Pseudomonadota bacterium]
MDVEGEGDLHDHIVADVTSGGDGARGPRTPPHPLGPNEILHVELLWHTPMDPDETNEGPENGADLDLHLLHPLAAGLDLDKDGDPDGWYDQPFDCFWANTNPDWGCFDPMVDDDPILTRDDRDGAGPESITLRYPEAVSYRVAVHYWHDHGFGPSLATVRVYWGLDLIFETSEVKLVTADLWEVCEIDWSTGAVTRLSDLDGEDRIIPGYVHPALHPQAGGF